MTSNPPVGHAPSLSGMAMGSLPTTPDFESSPEELALWMKAKEEEERKARLASWVDEQYTRCKNARIPFERQWYLNLAFTAGKQYVTPIDIPTAGFRLTTPKAPPWRVRLVVNKVRTAVRRECAKLTTSRPIPTVVPATSEDEDFSSASVGEQLLKTEFASAHFDTTYRSWLWWGTVCGNSFLKQYWDPRKPDYDAKALPPPPTFPTGEPIPPEILERIAPGVTKFLQEPQPAKGKICIERVTPFHIYVPDLLAESLEEQPYVIQVMTKTVGWVKGTYGFTPQCDTRASNTVLDATSIIAKGSVEHLDAVLVKEVWVKPHFHDDLPEGGVLTIINSKVVQFIQKWPSVHAEYPFYKYNAIPTGGFYSDSVVVDLIPVQKEYNKKRSQMIEIQNTMGKPKFFYQKGSLNPRMISSEPGQAIPYQAGYEPPIPIQGSEVPTSFVTEIQQLQTEFDDISGQHEISRGSTAESNVTSGTAIAYLQEQDDTMVTPNVASIEAAIELLGRHFLSNASTYWDDDRLIRITGKNDQFEALHWKKGMLRGNTDVKVQTGSALPFSKAARTALLTEMMQNGFVDPQSGLEMLDLGGLDKLLDEALVDKRQAVRENLKMANMPESALNLLLNPAPDAQGNVPPPVVDPATGQEIPINGDGTPFQPQPPLPANMWDNHEEHIHWHNHYRKTQQFELLGPMQKKAFEMHVQSHQLALQSQLVNQQGQVIEDNSMDAGGMEPPVEQTEEGPPTSPQ